MDIRNLTPDKIRARFIIEYCPFCDSEQVIFSEGITACPECGKPLAPCSVCENGCSGECPYGCNGTEDDERKPVTNPKITPDDAAWLYQFL